jgi:hypothetical protein
LLLLKRKTEFRLKMATDMTTTNVTLGEYGGVRKVRRMMKIEKA